MAQDEETRDLGEDELTQMMGIGYSGEVRQDQDGNLYQWVEGVDGLGNPVGFWRALRRLGRRLRPFLRRALPIAQRLAPFIPGVGPAVAAGLRVATPILQRAGVSGTNGLGALYQAPDGTLYQVQGLAQDEETRDLAEDEELQGFAQDEELQGFAQYEELQGLDQGYVREPGTSGLEAYVPQEPARTRWFNPPNQPPEMWKPLW
jgi:hypothetical protein